MPIFDVGSGKIVLRIVYDGPAFAGKTTNLKQLCGFITRERRGELYVPEESNGRTLFFDWLELDGGAIGQLRLSSQLLTVPGQASLQHRRTHLLRFADAVVFVCDSTANGVRDARHLLSILLPLRKRAGAPEVPLVLQANKQDLPSAHPPERVGELLRLGEDVVVAGAEACQGIGVRETAVLAIRCAVAQVRDKILRSGADSLEGVPQDAGHLYREMLLADPAKPSIFDTPVFPETREIKVFFSKQPRTGTSDDPSQ